MAIKLCFQAGHINRAGSGAPNEQEKTKRITDRLSALMREKGFEVYQTDYYAYNDPKVTREDYALFLALHADMDYPNDGGSGFADYADPATDMATTESQRICKIINDNYFADVGINYVSHSNANTRFYYMWKHLTAKTPCVLLEMGQSIDPHDSVLLGNTDLIANAIGRCICKAFNVPFDTTPVPPTPSELDLLKEINLNLTKEIEGLKVSQSELEVRITDLEQKLALSQKSEADWQQQLKTANKTNQTLSAEVAYYKPYKALYEAALKKTIDKFSKWELFQLLFK